jgi:hypothetical protein
LMMTLDETRPAAGEVAAADETTVSGHSSDGRTPCTRQQQRAPRIRRRQQRAALQERLHGSSKKFSRRWLFL